MILGVIALLVAGVLSLVVAGISIVILKLKKRIIPRTGGFISGAYDVWGGALEREESAKKWIDWLLWVTAILGVVIALTNIGIAVLSLVDRCSKG